MPNRCVSRRAFARAGLAAAIVLAAVFAAYGPAHAMGRGGPAIIFSPSNEGGKINVAPLAARMLAIAASFDGQGNPTPFREAWCRDFVNLVLERAGVRLADHSHLAVMALRLGRRVRDPRPGDLAVMAHHVTFFAGWDGQGEFLGLGGNQGHRVRVSRFARRAVIAFVRVA